MTRTMRIEDVLDLTVPSQPSISPDGTLVAYVLGGIDAAADKAISSIWLTGAAGTARRLTQGTTDTAPVFSPDGGTLAFLRDGQLWTLPVTGGEPVQRTHLPLGAGAPVWSPAGDRIVFAAPVDGEAAADETDADRAARAQRPLASDGVNYQADGSGFLRGIRMQLHLVDLESGAVRQLTDADEHAASPSWAPDGDFIAYTVKPDGVDDLTFRMAVHVIDPADAAAPARIVAFADGVAATVAYAPDGRHLVVVGWAGEPEGIARLYRVDLATGEARELAASLDRNVMPGAPAYPGALPQVTADGDVLFAIRDRGCTHLYAVPLAGGEPRRIHGGDNEVVSGLSVAGSKAAIALSTATSFGEIVLLDLAAGTSAVVTAHGAAPEGVELFVRESRDFAISDGVTVQGWLLRDPAVTGPTPLLVDVHGGPHNAWNGAVDEMHVFHQELAARGWTVLTINPRGSDGYGEEFFQAVNGNWGLIDAKDFLEPIDALVAEGAVDAQAPRAHRLQLRRVHDLLPHRARRPLRRGRRRRCRRRHDEHGRHDRRRAPAQRLRDRRHAVGSGRPRAARRDVALLRRRQGHHPDPRAARRERRPLPRRAGGAVALRAARARHPDPPRRLPGCQPHLPDPRRAEPPGRLRHARRRVGRAVRGGCRGPASREDRRRALAAPPRGARRTAQGARRAARHPAPGWA